MKTQPRFPGPARWPLSVRSAGGGAAAAFSLLEVLIAIGIFFIVAFAVLEIVVVGLGAARSLQTRHADVGMLASEFSTTNTLLEEGIESGDFGDFYPNARWDRTVTEVSSNGLFQVDFMVHEKVGRHEISSQMSLLLYQPASPRGRMSGGFGRGPGLQPPP